MFTSEFNVCIPLQSVFTIICKLSYASQECLTKYKIKCLLSPAAEKGILGLGFGLGVDWERGLIMGSDNE